jgi:hypothetical protein
MCGIPPRAMKALVGRARAGRPCREDRPLAGRFRAHHRVRSPPVIIRSPLASVHAASSLPSSEPLGPATVMASSVACTAVASSEVFFSVMASSVAFAVATFFAVVASSATFAASTSSATFFAAVASSAAFTATTSSVAFFYAVASLATAASAAILAAVTVVAATSLTVVTDPLPPDPPGIVDATTFGIGCVVGGCFRAYCPGSETASVVDPLLRTCLILLTRGAMSSDDVSVFLYALEAGSDGAIFSFPLPRLVVVSALPRLAAASVSGMCMPWD